MTSAKAEAPVARVLRHQTIRVTMPKGAQLSVAAAATAVNARLLREVRTRLSLLVTSVRWRTL